MGTQKRPPGFSPRNAKVGSGLESGWMRGGAQFNLTPCFLLVAFDILEAGELEAFKVALGLFGDGFS